MSKPIEKDPFVPMSIEDIIKKCQSFDVLTTLDITETDVEGPLANIEPYCKSLSELRIEIRPNHDVTEYEPLGGLPELMHFNMIGQHEPGSLAPFLKQSAKTNTLSIVEFDNAELNKEEVVELTSIKSVQIVKCGFTDQQSIGLLTTMANLHTLIITTELNIDIMIQVVAIFKNAKKRMRIQLKQEDSEFLLQWQSQQLVIYVLDDDPIDMAMLAPISDLQDIKYLTIRGPHLNGSLADLFWGFNACESTKLQDLVISNGTSLTSAEFSAVASIKSLKVLECGLADSPNTEQLSNLTELRELCIDARSEEDSLEGLFRALASKKEPTLQYFILTEGMLNYMEAEELAKIKSLKYLACKFADIESLRQLEQLNNLEFAYINVRQRYFQASEQAEHLLNFLGCCQKEVQFGTRGCFVTYNEPQGLLNVAFKKKECDAALCSQLGMLRNIKRLRISGRHTIGNIDTLLEGILLHNELDTLELNKLEGNEIPIVAQMSTLLKITSGIPNALNINLLAHLPHLKVLTVTVHHPGSLENLFHDLAVRELPSQLETLAILGVYLMPEEVAELAKISSLRRLRCGLVDTFDEWSLAELSNHSLLEELNIRSYLSGSLVELFKALQPMNHFHRLVVRGCRLSNKEMKAIKRIRSLRSLHCGLSNARDIGMLARLPLLEELVIEAITEIYHNALALLAQKEPQTLKKLSIKNKYLGGDDFNSMVSMTCLESLDCIVYNAFEIKCLALLNLTELILHCPQDISIRPLLTALAAKDPQVFHSFELNKKFLRESSTRLLVQIKSLRILNMGFSDSASFDLLNQLTELTILKIKSKTYHVKQILKLFKNCLKLEEIHFLERNEEVNSWFISQCMDVLKTVRNPQEQKPLKMYCHSLSFLSLDQEHSVDSSFLIIDIQKHTPLDYFHDEIFKEPSDDSTDSDEPKNDFPGFLEGNSSEVPEDTEPDSTVMDVCED
ncbi:uncharacterized protein LOC108053525 [Drosophila rhopaloa]|uniref:Uncharacterized protein n=1 Tax=Drosophila rhopaloa TaxID=1041015 RepID=A0ABM5I812_DRORH|nr:uncharacterized protein LOC108053525 [Drosophila rhopaloa]